MFTCLNFTQAIFCAYIAELSLAAHQYKEVGLFLRVGLFSRNYSITFINESSYSLLYGTESFQNSFPTCRHFGFKSSRVLTMRLWMLRADLLHLSDPLRLPLSICGCFGAEISLLLLLTPLLSDGILTLFISLVLLMVFLRAA